MDGNMTVDDTEIQIFLAMANIFAIIPSIFLTIGSQGCKKPDVLHIFLSSL